jgi:hypothetical protein
MARSRLCSARDKADRGLATSTNAQSADETDSGALPDRIEILHSQK